VFTRISTSSQEGNIGDTSKGEGKSYEDTADGAAAVLVDVTKELSDGFGPLKAVLWAISAVYTDDKVRLQPLFESLL